jgi:cytochrome b involved in lipid metabolism
MADTTTVYTLEQVRSHNTDKDCWLVINNKIYDATAFLPEVCIPLPFPFSVDSHQHPGGGELVLDVAGVSMSHSLVNAHPSIQDATAPRSSMMWATASMPFSSLRACRSVSSTRSVPLDHCLMMMTCLPARPRCPQSQDTQGCPHACCCSTFYVCTIVAHALQVSGQSQGSPVLVVSAACCPS